MEEVDSIVEPITIDTENIDRISTWMDDTGEDNNVNVENEQEPQTVAEEQGWQGAQVADVKEPENGWNEKLELLIRDMALKTLALRRLHGQSSRLYARRNNVLTIVLIAMSSVSSMLTIFPLTNGDPWNPFDLLVKFFTYFVTFLTVLNRYLKFEQKSEQHRAADAKYLEFYHNLQQQLLIRNWKLRIEGTKFMKIGFDIFSKIMKEAPPLPKKYVNRRGTRPAPDEADQDITIGVGPGQVPLTVIAQPNPETTWVLDLDPSTRYLLERFTTPAD